MLPRSPEAYTSGLPFLDPFRNPTCQRPAHSEVMLPEPSRWDGFPNDSTWPHLSNIRARKIDEKMVRLS